jgi:hypothetical protein
MADKKIDELKNKIFGALADPDAPWYGSDLVSWVSDYIEEVDKRIRYLFCLKCPPISEGDSCICPIEKLEELLTEYGRHSPGCPAQYDKKYKCKCGWDRERPKPRT